jgi:hypothetical protein
MHRMPTPPEDRLEKLLDERDNLRIRISLLLDQDNPDPLKLADLRDELSLIEIQVRAAERLQGWNG